MPVVQHRSADRGARNLGGGSAGLWRGLVGSSCDSPAIRPASLYGGVAVFLAAAAAHVILYADVSISGKSSTLWLLQPCEEGGSRVTSTQNSLAIADRAGGGNNLSCVCRYTHLQRPTGACAHWPAHCSRHRRHRHTPRNKVARRVADSDHVLTKPHEGARAHLE